VAVVLGAVDRPVGAILHVAGPAALATRELVALLVASGRIVATRPAVLRALGEGRARGEGHPGNDEQRAVEHVRLLVQEGPATRPLMELSLRCPHRRRQPAYNLHNRATFPRTRRNVPACP